MKKFLTFIIIALLSFSCIALVGCKKNEKPQPQDIKISLNKVELEMDLMETEVLEVTTNSTQKVVWTTDKAEVVTVSEGTITAVGEGTAIVTATVETVSASCKVTVTDSGAMAQIVIPYETLTLQVQDEFAVEAKLMFKNEEIPGDFKWDTDNEQIVTVADGKICAKAKGTAVVSVSCTFKGMLLQKKIYVSVN